MSSRAGVRAMTAATASGIAPRWTGMCSACAIIRPRSSKRAVEQSRRSLMFAENEERISTAPISSATARSAWPMTWSSMFTLRSLPREPPADTIPNPHPPRGKPARRAVELEDRRPDRGLSRPLRQDELRPRTDVGGPHRDELDPAVSVGVAVPLLVRGVEARREIGAQRNGQLVRLADVAELGLAVCR